MVGTLAIFAALSAASRAALAQHDGIGRGGLHTACLVVPALTVSFVPRTSVADAACGRYRLTDRKLRAPPVAEVSVGSRRSHVLVGAISGLLIGATAGAIIANHNAKKCHGESCQVDAALGGPIDIVVLGFGGGLLGGVIGAIWPR